MRPLQFEPHEAELVVSSPDTDVLLLLVHLYPHLPVSTVFLTGKGRLKRNISVCNIYNNFGQKRISALLGLHALTGSDMSGRFAGRTKDWCFQAFMSCDDVILDALAMPGNDNGLPSGNGNLPVAQKVAIVTPLLKKASLDPQDLKNYRPVSNLSFVSKLVERLVVKQLNIYLESNGLMPPLQSAYRLHHSTETALLNVMSDILMAADDRQVTLLALLDLSAAFDCVDHDIVLSRLRSSFGLEDTVLAWIRSFLIDRTQHVRCCSCFTQPRYLTSSHFSVSLVTLTLMTFRCISAHQ